MPLFYYTLSCLLSIKYQKCQSWSWLLPVYRQLCYEQLDSFLHELNWREIDKIIAAGNIIISYVSELKSLSRVRLFATLGLWPPRLLCPWDSPGRDAGMGCHALLQGIVPTQGSNPGVPHCRRFLYQLSCQGGSSHMILYIIIKQKYICMSELIRKHMIKSYFCINIITILLTITDLKNND